MGSRDQDADQQHRKEWLGPERDAATMEKPSASKGAAEDFDGSKQTENENAKKKEMRNDAACGIVPTAARKQALEPASEKRTEQQLWRPSFAKAACEEALAKRPGKSRPPWLLQPHCCPTRRRATKVL
jgi:hypothetical protein